ncbi:MAG: helix-hairpin-helix domain-containing protein [Candidatus Hydrogenedentes bacterium]|nr:helix-hairpin-helix domain-containing protein [Candidatus Hydrogenedentota bacterium]
MDGALHILIETINTDADVRAMIRQRMSKEGSIASYSTKNAEGTKTKFEAYYNFSEAAVKIPSHRLLAIQRGVKDGVLRMELKIDDDKTLAELGARFLKAPGTEFEPIIRQAVEDAYRRHLRPSIESEVMAALHERADLEAIRVFRENAQNLLLAPPAGRIPVVGIVPGLKNGCMLAVVDASGAYLESAAVFPHPPQNNAAEAEIVLLALMQKHQAFAVAIGNGAGSRETAAFVKAALAQVKGHEAFSALVNEAGASAYASSKISREELPNVETNVREAISIARRLQDPLAELVKVEPRSIGVGQYQHDVNQKELREGLHRTMVSCVNRVGVDLNTASVYLLRYASGLLPETAKNIIEYRTKIGAFTSRQQLNEVSGVGRRVFEQCAGFIRVAGENPLDMTAIHPEAYPIVERIAASLGLSLAEIIGNEEALGKVDLAAFVDETTGMQTLLDIRNELVRPQCDPRPAFKVPKYIEGVNSVTDLEDGMELEGVVTNVTDFGAFVDVGVHQDGLVHLSELANRFVREAHEVVKVGDVVKVKVLKVDKAQPRISLSIRALLPPPEKKPRPEPRRRPAPAAPAASGDGQAAPAEARSARASHSERPARREQRPEQRDRTERPRRDDGRPRTQRPGKPTGKSQRPAAAPRHEEKGGGLNTLLADQLAALKGKFGS